MPCNVYAHHAAMTPSPGVGLPFQASSVVHVLSLMQAGHGMEALIKR